MKFGKRLRLHLQETLPDWRDKYLCYKVLKILVKQIPTTAGYDYQWQVDADAAAAVGNVHGELYARYHPERNRRLIVFHQSFVRFLNEELEKFNYFFLEKEEEFIIRLQIQQELQERIELNSSNSESEFSEEMMNIGRDFVSIRGEMMLLKNYSFLNFVGLMKILKKYDKRTGGLLRPTYTQLALRQPFFTTEILTRLLRECEANLERTLPNISRSH